MSRDTLPLRAVVCFLCRFPGARRSRASVACPALMAGHRGPPTWRPPPLLEARSPPRASAAQSASGALRPRPHAVPSPRPLPKRGGTCPVRQGEPGAGEGPHPGPVDASRRRYQSQSGRPSTRPGAGQSATGLLRVPGRSHGERDPGQLCGRIPSGPVRRRAPPLGALRRGGTGPSETPWRVGAWSQRRGPSGGRAPARPGPCPVLVLQARQVLLALVRVA